MMTREYPPEVYGGAGVHVTELVAQLRHLCEVDVHCMGQPRDTAIVAQPDPALAGANAALTTLSADLVMVNDAAAATVVHSHTWYAGFAGHVAAMLYGVPHVLTAHSLEPMRPWKAEQLGGGYRVSSWVERTAVEAAAAVIAVSAGMREDVLSTYPALDPDRVHVVKNGIDTAVWYPVEPGAGSVLAELGVDPAKPIVAFVGRITRQKGVAHLVAAAHHFAPDVQLVLCAGAPDTPEIAAEVKTAPCEQLQAARSGVFWVQDMLPTEQDSRNSLGVNGFRMPVGLRAARHREPRGDGVRHGGRRLGRRRHSRGGRTTGTPGCSCTTTRRTPPTSSRSWPTPSTLWSPTQVARPSSAARVVSGASTSSPGRQSPSRLSRSIARFPRKYGVRLSAGTERPAARRNR